MNVGRSRVWKNHRLGAFLWAPFCILLSRATPFWCSCVALSLSLASLEASGDKRKAILGTLFCRPPPPFVSPLLKSFFLSPQNRLRRFSFYLSARLYLCLLLFLFVQQVPASFLLLLPNSCCAIVCLFVCEAAILLFVPPLLPSFSSFLFFLPLPPPFPSVYSGKMKTKWVRKRGVGDVSERLFPFFSARRDFPNRKWERGEEVSNRKWLSVVTQIPLLPTVVSNRTLFRVCVCYYMNEYIQCILENRLGPVWNLHV